MQAEWLGAIAEECAFVEIDCHMLPESYQVLDFWEQVLVDIGLLLPEPKIQLQLDVVRRSMYGSFTLKQLFDVIAQHYRRVVLLIDEFDSLLHHPNFNTAEFFGALRSLSALSDGLILVIASRLSIAELNRRSQEINPLGSPFFNTFTEVRLLPLQLEEVDQLLDQMLKGTSVVFTAEERAYILRMAGRHPYLVQTTAAALFESIAQGKTGNERFSTATITLRRWTNAHFEDLWRHLSREAQTVIVILVLAEMKGHLDGQIFDVSTLGQLSRHKPELERLADLGLVERNQDDDERTNSDRFPEWQHTRCRVSAGSFVLWLTSTVLSRGEGSLDFDTWLRDCEREGLFTKSEKANVKAITDVIPHSVVSSGSKFVDTLLPKLSSQRIEVFFSYAHEDEEMRNELAKHLQVLVRQGIISEWHDREISAGTEWRGSIDAHLNTAHIILLLISSDFMASHYCYDIEMRRALERHNAQEACVIPVILRSVIWENTPFAKLQALPIDGRPVSSWPDRDAALTNIAKGIRTAIEKLSIQR